MVGNDEDGIDEEGILVGHEIVGTYEDGLAVGCDDGTLEGILEGVNVGELLGCVGELDVG